MNPIVVSLRYCFMIKDKPYRLNSVIDLAELNGIGVDKFISGLRKQSTKKQRKRRNRNRMKCFVF